VQLSGPIYLTEDIRRMEHAAGADAALMERAGAAAAELALTLAGDKGKDVLVLAGPGNNGGDARVVAERLKEKFFRVHVASQVDQIPQKSWGLVIDGLFGIGLARDVAGEYAALVDYANRQRCPVLALDIPSGVPRALSASRIGRMPATGITYRSVSAISESTASGTLQIRRKSSQ